MLDFPYLKQGISPSLEGVMFVSKGLYLIGEYSLYGPVFVLDKGRLGLLVCRTGVAGGLSFRAACCNEDWR